MAARPRHRLRLSTTAIAAVALVSGLTAAPARADLPPQEPGVTLRVFDVQTPLSKLCTLKPAQTPNIDKLMPTINWTGTDFGIENYFVAQALANLTVPSAGSYTFRLSSDDGSRLSIDDAVVIDHDGLHGLTSKEGAAELGAGVHPLRIDHFERDGGQDLKLEWRPPGASSFEVVPNSALSTEADVVRVTAPGAKECEGTGDSPGDGLPLTGVHPNYDLVNLRPSGFEPKVTGMDWFPDGRLAVLTWGGSNDSGTSSDGEVHILDEVTGSTGPGQVTRKKIAGGLKEPMGLKIVDGVVYVSEKDQLTRLVDTDGDEVTDDYQSVATWPYGGNFHEFAFGLLYDEPNFYLNLSVSINYGGATTDPQPAANRGTTIKVNKNTGAVSYVAGGLRTPHGIGWGPENGLFVTDNQGGWLPSSKLLHIKQDRFFNHYMNPDGPFDDKPVTAPVLWMPQNEIANSPSTPVLVKEGTFAGQLLIGDVTYGGIQRAYLEKVNGEYQGALFRLTQGLEAGVSELSIGPDGAVYAGGLGAGGNWGQEGKLTYGLQKLSPNGTNAFDMLAMRAKPGGFEIEYTQPVSTETANALATRYQVEQWRYQPTASYGGPKIDEQTLTVTSATLSADRKKVTLAVGGLKSGHVVHVRSPRPFTSSSGESLWSTEAWYTLNALVGDAPGTAGPSQEAEDAALSGGAEVNTDHPGYTGSGFVAGYWNSGAATTFTVAAEEAGPHDVRLRYSNGPNPFSGTKTVSLYVNGAKVRQISLASTGTWQTWADHVESVDLDDGVNTIAIKYDNGDSGNVNLDNISISAGDGTADRITLFDGSSLASWEKTDGSAATWPVADGSMEAVGGDIRTKQSFGDFKLHVEWYEPQLPPEVTGQQRGNSGVYLQDRYELQVLDSFGDTTLADDEAGSIYDRRAPDSNAATAPETWQTYEVTFRAARFDGSGNKTANARVTVVWNGTTVHNDVEIEGPTGGGAAESAAAGPIRLQDHGDPGANVRYRTIWVEPLS